MTTPSPRQRRRAAKKTRQDQARSTHASQRPDRSDLPPDAAAFMKVLDDSGPGFNVESSASGTVWTIKDPHGDTFIEARSGPATDDPRPPAGTGATCMDLKTLWSNQDFRRELDSGLVDLYGRPLHPEGTDFLTALHTAHDH